MKRTSPRSKWNKWRLRFKKRSKNIKNWL